MRRWNGWGDERTNYPLPETASRFLAMLVGEGKPAPDAALEPGQRTIGRAEPVSRRGGPARRGALPGRARR